MENPQQHPQDASIFLIFLSMFTAYYGIEKLLLNVFRSRYPNVHESLLKKGHLTAYIAFVMGMLVTFLSTPFCLAAFHGSSDENDTREHPHYSTAGNICLTFKALIWTAELNRLDFARAYVAHHVSALTSLSHHLYFNIPLRALYAIYASCVTELASDLAAILGYHGLNADNSRVAYTVHVAAYLGLIFLRLPAVLYAATLLRYSDMSEPVFWTNLLSLLFYGSTLVKWIVARTRTLKILQINPDSRNSPITVGQNLTITRYGIFFSLSSLVTALLTGIIIIAAPDGWSLFSRAFPRLFFQTALISLIGSRIPGVISMHGIKGLLSHRLLTARSGLSLQGSMFAGGLFLMLVPQECISLTDRLYLLAAVAISSLIGETIGRIGCHFAGCCGSVYRGAEWEKRADLPFSVPVHVAKLNAFFALGLLSIFLYGLLSLRTAGAYALIIQAGIRLSVEMYRCDVALHMRVLTYAQFIFGLAMLLQYPAEFSAGSILPETCQGGSVATFEIQHLFSDRWAVGLVVVLTVPGIFTSFCS